MSNRAFTHFITSIQDHINTLGKIAGILEKKVRALTVRPEGGGGPNAEQAAG